MVTVSRLAQAVNASDGVSFDEVAARGQNALEDMAEEAKAQMNASVAALGAASAAYAANPDEQNLSRIHAIVTELYSVAGLFGEAHLSSAGKTLADFIEETGAPERCPPALIKMFAAAITSLQRGGAAAGQTPAQLANELSLLASRTLSGKCNFG